MHFVIRFALHEFYNTIYRIFYIVRMPVGTLCLFRIHHIHNKEPSVFVV